MKAIGNSSINRQLGSVCEGLAIEFESHTETSTLESAGLAALLELTPFSLKTSSPERLQYPGALLPKRRQRDTLATHLTYLT